MNDGKQSQQSDRFRFENDFQSQPIAVLRVFAVDGLESWRGFTAGRCSITGLQ